MEAKGMKMGKKISDYVRPPHYDHKKTQKNLDQDSSASKISVGRKNGLAEKS